MLLSEICVKQYFPLNLRIRTAKTQHQYDIALRCLGRFLQRPPTIDDLTDDTLTMWMSSLLRRTDPPLSVHTVRERANRILALWTWLARRRIVPTFPTVQKPEAPETLP